MPYNDQRREARYRAAHDTSARFINLKGAAALRVLAAFLAGTDPLDLLDDLALNTKDVVRFVDDVDEEGNPTRLAVWESFFKDATRIKPVLSL